MFMCILHNDSVTVTQDSSELAHHVNLFLRSTLLTRSLCSVTSLNSSSQTLHSMRDFAFQSSIVEQEQEEQLFQVSGIFFL